MQCGIEESAGGHSRVRDSAAECGRECEDAGCAGGCSRVEEGPSGCKKAGKDATEGTGGFGRMQKGISGSRRVQGGEAGGCRNVQEEDAGGRFEEDAEAPSLSCRSGRAPPGPCRAGPIRVGQGRAGRGVVRSPGRPRWGGDRQGRRRGPPCPALRRRRWGCGPGCDRSAAAAAAAGRRRWPRRSPCSGETRPGPFPALSPPPELGMHACIHPSIHPLPERPGLRRDHPRRDGAAPRSLSAPRAGSP